VRCCIVHSLVIGECDSGRIMIVWHMLLCVYMIGLHDRGYILKECRLYDALCGIVGRGDTLHDAIA
jgi:hypothetical protein